MLDRPAVKLSDPAMRPFLTAWIALFVVTAAALSPPLLFREVSPAAEAGCLVHLSFSSLCHQIPGRSLQCSGYPPAVCARCLALYIGILAGCSAVLIALRRGHVRILPWRPPPAMLVTLLVFAMLEPLLCMASVIDAPPCLRLASGFVLGAVPFLLFPGRSGSWREREPARRTTGRAPDNVVSSPRGAKEEF